MKLDPKLNEAAAEALMRAAVSQQLEIDRAGRVTVAMFAAALFILSALGAVLLDQLAGNLISLSEGAAEVAIGAGGFEWSMLLPLAVVVYLLSKVYRHERDRIRLEAGLTTATIEALRRDLLD